MVIGDFHSKTMACEAVNGSRSHEVDGLSKAVKSIIPGLKCFANTQPESPTNSADEFMKSETAFIKKQRCETGIKVCSPSEEKSFEFQTEIITKSLTELKVFSTAEEKTVRVENVVRPKPCTTPEVMVCSTKEDEDTYSFTHDRRGLAVIINNVDFSQADGFGDRKGSDVDAANLCESLTSLGFDIRCLRNLSVDQMVNQLLLAARTYEHKDADCFVCVVLSHGEESYTHRAQTNCLPPKSERKDLLFGVDGRAVSTKYVVEMFNDERCPDLRNKPRLFFFQACRGSKLDDGTIVNVVPHVMDTIRTSCRHHRADHDSHSSSTDPPHLLPIPLSGVQLSPRPNLLSESTSEPVLVNPYPDTLYKDCLVMHASPPGYLSWRDPEEGSWFIQSLCQVLNCKEVKSGSLTLSKALTLVCRLVATGYESYNSTDGTYHRKKEEPVVYSMLVKDIVMKVKTKQKMSFT